MATGMNFQSGQAGRHDRSRKECDSIPHDCHETVFDLVRLPHYHPALAEIVTYPAESLIKQIHSS
jgi:hypothetical protein